MITLVEALNYRCLRYIRQPLGEFHVLVGPNASGKTTFLDVIAFLGQLVSEGLEAAVSERSENFHDLVWNRSGDQFELAIEAKIPESRKEKLENKTFDTIRYEVAIGEDLAHRELAILSEKAILKKSKSTKLKQRELFPAPPTVPENNSIISPKTRRGTKTVVNKVSGGNDNFYDETGKGWDHAFKLGPKKSALGNLPDDESKFPVSTWLKKIMTDGVQPFVLNSALMRKASPPGKTRSFKSDGSNLPWVLKDFKGEPYARWIQHVKTALPDIKEVRTVEREEDRHRYLTIVYERGSEIPSWTASDGTLRLLALTLPAYLKDFQGVYLIEEPENGIHPSAVETVVQSLSSVYDAQILLATHSPVILSVVEADKILCFSKTKEGATDIVTGDAHPRLKDWKGDPNLSVYFASGVLD